MNTLNQTEGVAVSAPITTLEITTPKQNRPKIVCLCGSTRFMEAFQRANYMEGLAGRIVLSICCMTTSDAAKLESWGTSPETKKKLDELHKAKIRMCDEVYVLNVGDYIGETTADEIAYAQSLGKPIRWLEGRRVEETGAGSQEPGIESPQEAAPV
jgi:hypothetical protein